jgi:hypothetical protein
VTWLDRLMHRLTARGTKVVASGHPPADTEPPTGSPELSEELEADYGPDTRATEPPADEPGSQSADCPVAPRSRLLRMGIGDWFRNLRKREDDAAVRRAREDVLAGSVEERELRAGDIEGLAADERAARSVGEPSIHDVDRLDPE